MSEPVNVTNMDFGISDVDWIVELFPKGIIQGKDPRPCLHVDTGTEAQREISHKIIRQGLLVIAPLPGIVPLHTGNLPQVNDRRALNGRAVRADRQSRQGAHGRVGQDLRRVARRPRGDEEASG